MHVFLKLTHHSWCTLIHAAPSSDLALVHLINSDAKVGGGLANDQYLFVENLLVEVASSDKLHFDVVFDKGHGGSSHRGTMEEHWGGDTSREGELEGDYVVTWVEDTSAEMEAGKLGKHDGLLALS